MKPTLLILAAGMGSRYGGLKQLDKVGPHGETIMDYSIYDAVRSGFGKVVFVIRKDFEDQFRTQVLSKYNHFVPVEIVFQQPENLPEGFTKPEERTKPWGTGHAVLMGKDVIKEPFAVINSDDFYGHDAYITLGKFLSALDAEDKGRYAMVAFRVGNTTTPNGEVSRGVCTVNETNHLSKVVERHHIGYDENGNIRYKDENDEWRGLEETTPVSMNFWGFTPDYFDLSVRELKRFLTKYINIPGKEFYIPSVVDKLIGNGEATVEVLPTDSRWFGVTYAEDKDKVRDKLKKLHEEGIYPENLFE